MNIFPELSYYSFPPVILSFRFSALAALFSFNVLSDNFLSLVSFPFFCFDMMCFDIIKSESHLLQIRNLINMLKHKALKHLPSIRYTIREYSYIIH